jgi:hypothetical protein
LKLQAVSAIMSQSREQEALLSETEPIAFRPRHAPASSGGAGMAQAVSGQAMTRFDRSELREILSLYGRMVAAGEWRDYAMDFLKDRAVFSVYRHASEWPLYRIEKSPRLARRQGAYSVVTATGLILKRGHELRRVLAALEPRLKAIEA